MLGALLAVVVVATFGGSGNDAPIGRLGGDLPSFYGAGRIVLDGRGPDLYDAAVQAEAQRGLLDTDDELYYFAYPPYTALAFAPLAALPFRAAYLVHTMLMAAALWFAIVAARPLAPRLLGTRERMVAALSIALFVYPVLRSVLGGQNATLTLLLAVAVWRFAADEHDLAAGLALGAMFYKPQFGLVVLVLILVARRWRVALYGAGGLAALWLIGAAVMQGSWVGHWLDQVGRFDETNLASNGSLMVSIVGFTRNALEGWPAIALAAVLGLIVGLPTVWMWIRSGTDLDGVALAAPALPLLAASALYYDGAMILVTGLVILERQRPPSRAALVVGSLLAATWFEVFRDALGWSPTFLVLLAAWGLALSTSSSMTRV